LTGVSGHDLSIVENREDGVKHFTLAAYPHLLMPRGLRLSLTNGAVDEPAQVPELELPRGAGLLGVDGAALNGPASPVFVVLHEREFFSIPAQSSARL
jgi:hypothetical protein